MVLALLGLFGVLAAGVAADALLTSRDDLEDDDETAPPSVDDTELSSDNLLDDISGPDGADPRSDDRELAEPEDVSLSGTDGDDDLSGGLGHDRLTGLAGDDLLDGRAGDDWIDAGGGDDAAWAGEGNDTLSGDTGSDSLNGQEGDDLIAGGAGHDSLTGGLGDDTLSGDQDDDTLLGGMGQDSLSGGQGADWLAGGYGDDSLAGGDGSDTLDGNAGDDWLSGLDGEIDDFDEDFLNADAGNDTLVVGSGDHAHGGEGEDEFVLHDWLAEGGVAHVADYDASLDKLIVVYDPAVHPDPVLTVEMNAEGTETTLFLDGTPMATIRGDAVDLSDVDLRAA